MKESCEAATGPLTYDAALGDRIRLGTEFRYSDA
jgi:hypothetical protein